MTDNWNDYWKNESNSAYWAEPDKAVISLLAKIDKTKTSKVLDLGCGIGRHALLFAKAGFSVTAVDSSAEALALLKNRALEEGVKIKITEGDYTQNLFPRNYFDLVISFNVLYHGYRKNFEAVIYQVLNWLKPGGQFFFTCPTRRDGKFGSGEKIAPNTFKSLNSIHPGGIHYFSDEADIRDLTRDFSRITKNIREHHWDNNGKDQLSSHWEVLATR